MMQIDLTETQIKYLVTHRVGNKLRDEGFTLSDDFSLFEEETGGFLIKYFLLPVKKDEVFRFSHPIKLELNDVFSLVQDIFTDTGKFIEHSQGIAKLLYEQSMHPKIKEGELNVVYFSKAILGDEVVDAIGIFKSETTLPFLRMKEKRGKFSINHDFGFDLKGLDKGCLILNLNPKEGYDILLAEGVGKGLDAQYWSDDFLKMVPKKDEFQQTHQFLNIARNFVTKGMDDNTVSKVDKIELLNRSVEYFKNHNSFEKEEFEEAVFKSEDLINDFRNFDTAFREEKRIQIEDSFDISQNAVRKQAKVFKRVVKLDKNFDIHIHGNRDLLEKGVEKDGRKFYKIYYENES
ncbi:MAG: nucleoid-associated protein [Bacteroidetes bacterium]|nr:nucleoid-associated protein [Bacteroidota bacterium]